MNVEKVEAALEEAVNGGDWTTANACADLLKKLRELSSPLGVPTRRWFDLDGELPVKIHPTEGDAPVVKSRPVNGSGDYL